jgi:hypothetical protein
MINPLMMAFALAVALLLATSAAHVQGQTVYIGNNLTDGVGGAADNGSPLVILGEYSRPSPLPSSTVILPNGMVQDVTFYGKNYNFTLYALVYVGPGFNTNEQMFQVVASQSFSNSAVANPGTNTVAVTNFPVFAGAFLAFCGQGPYYPQTVNDAYNSDATYQNPSNPNLSIATPPGSPGTIFSVGINSDTSTTYRYITNSTGNQGRAYGIGVDVLEINYTFFTIAGTKSAGSTNALGTNARFNGPEALAADANFNVYVADTTNDTIRLITNLETNWGVSTIAGAAGVVGSTNGSNGLSARFNHPEGIALDRSGNVYVADTLNNTVRMLTNSGGVWMVTTIAGGYGTNGFGTNDGMNLNDYFHNPQGLAVDTNGNLYVADSLNDTIRMITHAGANWDVSTIGGSARNPGYIDGTNNQARFDNLEGVAVDLAGNLYVADSGNNTIREGVHQGSNWIFSTIAGGLGTNRSGSADGTNSSALFNNPHGIAASTLRNLFVTDGGNDTIRNLYMVGTNWVVTTIGGMVGTNGYSSGTGTNALFSDPHGICVNPLNDVVVDGDAVSCGVISFGVDQSVLTGNSNTAVQVLLAPTNAILAGAAWDVSNSTSFWLDNNQPGTGLPLAVVLTPSFFTTNQNVVLEFLNISNRGWNTPVEAPTGLSIDSTVNIFTNLPYTVKPPWLTITNGLSIYGTIDEAYTIQYSTNLVQGPWATLITTPPLGKGYTNVESWPPPWAPAIYPAASNTVFFRAVWTGN